MCRGWLLVAWLSTTMLLLGTASPAWAGKSAATRSYTQAREQYRALKGSSARQRYRHHWIKVIATLMEVAEQHPRSTEAPQALFLAAELWHGLYGISRRSSDLNQALTVYERLEKEYPRSSLADDSLLKRARIYLEQRADRKLAPAEVGEVLARYPKGDMAPEARKLSRELGAVTPPPRPPQPRTPDTAKAAPKLFGRQVEGGPVPQVQSIKHWSNPVYTRVAVYLSQPAEVRSGEIPADRAANTPPRIFVDLAAATLAPNVQAETAINDDLLRRVRVAHHVGDKVRLVLDLKKSARPRVMVMENPYRVVIDAMVGDDTGDAEELPPVANLATRRRVVIDPGHGGHDSGAVGRGGVKEKDVALAIAKELQRLLEAAGVETALTRNDDTYISLEERTAIANRLGADAFVSIHCNSAPHGRARGIETYYLNVTDDRYSIRLAAVENKTSEEQVSDLQLILADLSTKANSAESMGLARTIQRHMVSHATPLNRKVKDLGVKASLFYVLLGARMPAVLVETSFLSNAEEAKLLASSIYQRTLATALSRALTQHLKAPMRLVQP